MFGDRVPRAISAAPVNLRPPFSLWKGGSRPLPRAPAPPPFLLPSPEGGQPRPPVHLPPHTLPGSCPPAHHHLLHPAPRAACMATLAALAAARPPHSRALGPPPPFQSESATSIILLIQKNLKITPLPSAPRELVRLRLCRALPQRRGARATETEGPAVGSARRQLSCTRDHSVIVAEPREGPDARTGRCPGPGPRKRTLRCPLPPWPVGSAGSPIIGGCMLE